MNMKKETRDLAAVTNSFYIANEMIVQLMEVLSQLLNDKGYDVRKDIKRRYNILQSHLNAIRILQESLWKDYEMAFDDWRNADELRKYGSYMVRLLLGIQDRTCENDCLTIEEAKKIEREIEEFIMNYPSNNSISKDIFERFIFR